MGGGVANKQQANAADAGATRAANNAGVLSSQTVAQGQNLNATARADAAKLQPQADRYGAERTQLYNALWGSPTTKDVGTADVNPGALTDFLDPSKLNTRGPTGPYEQMYTRANEDTARATQDAVAAVRQNANNRGFGNGSGLEADAELKARLAGADAKGRNFGAATNASHEEALNNFWNTVQAAQADKGASQSGQLNTQGLQQNYNQSGSQAEQTGTGQGITANQGAAQTYNQLYGVAGAYHPSAAGQIVGSALGAGGAIGGAALTGGGSTAVKAAGVACVCGDTRIMMYDGSFKSAKQIKAGDQVRSRDGSADQVVGVDVETHAPCYLLATAGRRVLRASGSHTLERPEGGYIRVSECMGARLSTPDGADAVVELSTIGSQPVYRIRLQHAHIYLSDGLWSLE